MQTIFPFLSTENKNLEWHSILALLYVCLFYLNFFLELCSILFISTEWKLHRDNLFFEEGIYLIFSMLYYLNMYRFILGGVPSFWVQDHIGIFSTCKDKGKGNINVFYSARKVQFRLSLCPSSTGRLLSIFPSQ